MPAAIPSRVLEFPKGWKSNEAASFVVQLDFLSARRFFDLKGCTPAELAWQPRLGANTIGMLLAHVAIVEVYWLLMALGRWKPRAMPPVLGLDMEDDGMPLKPRGRAPRALKGRTLAWYLRLHRRARTFTTRNARRMSPADMRKVVQVRRADGTRVPVNVRWILFHVLEHEAAHYGQMMSLRHEWRDRSRRAR